MSEKTDCGPNGSNAASDVPRLPPRHDAGDIARHRTPVGETHRGILHRCGSIAAHSCECDRVNAIPSGSAFRSATGSALCPEVRELKAVKDAMWRTTGTLVFLLNFLCTSLGPPVLVGVPTAGCCCAIGDRAAGRCCCRASHPESRTAEADCCESRDSRPNCCSRRSTSASSDTATEARSESGPGDPRSPESPCVASDAEICGGSCCSEPPQTPRTASCCSEPRPDQQPAACSVVSRCGCGDSGIPGLVLPSEPRLAAVFAAVPRSASFEDHGPGSDASPGGCRERPRTPPPKPNRSGPGSISVSG